MSLLYGIVQPMSYGPRTSCKRRRLPKLAQVDEFEERFLSQNYRLPRILIDEMLENFQWRLYHHQPTRIS